MDIWISIPLVLGALLAGAISPGPSFVLVASKAMGVSRKDGIAASIGMGAGGVLLSLFALMGLQAFLQNVPLLYLMLKLFGGCYLVYLAIRLWKNARQPLVVERGKPGSQSQLLKSFLVALITQLSNPKAAIIYGGIFAALLPASFPTEVYFILPPLVFLVEAGWYLVVTLILSSSSPRAAYLKSKAVYDYLTSGILAAIGLKLIFSTANR